MGKRVLYVNDSKSDRDDYAGCLRKDLGCEVFEAENGVDGVRQYEEYPDLDLIITDLQMAGSDGFLLIKEIRKRNKHLRRRRIPILVASSMSWPNIQLALRMGADDHLDKGSYKGFIDGVREYISEE